MRAAILRCLANNIVGLTLTLLRAYKGRGMFLNQTQSGSRKKSSRHQTDAFDTSSSKLLVKVMLRDGCTQSLGKKLLVNKVTKRFLTSN